MTDILTAQAAIKSRHPLRDPSGRFARADEAIRLALAAERMKARLLVDVPEIEHAAGKEFVGRFYRRYVAPKSRRQVIPDDPHSLFAGA